MRGRSYWILAIAAGCFLQSGPDAAVRSRAEIPAAKVFAAMQAMGSKGEWERLKKSISLLNPLIEEIDLRNGSSFKDDLARSIERSDRKRVSGLIRRLIVASINQLLDQVSRERSLAKRRRQLRLAFSEFLLLEKRFRKVDFQSARKVTMDFRRVNAISANESYREEFESLCVGIQHDIESLMSKLEEGE